jgi:carboxyl-terminal processing protease
MNDFSPVRNRKIFITIKKVFIFFILSVFASQCFSESQSTTAEEAEDPSLRYLRTLNSVFSYVQQNYVDDVDPKILYEGALKGMMEALGDPYTVYLNTDDMRDLTDTTKGNFGGVGLSITKPVSSTPENPAYVEVASPIEDTPGAKAGIQSGDFITTIDDKPTPEMTMQEVLSNLRGKIGTSVKVSILRGKDISFSVSLVRALIEVPTVKYGMINDTGYLRIIEFTPDTPKRVQDAIDSFEKNQYTGLIIDLRNNPGGLITSVTAVADKFIDDGPVVSTKSRLSFENTVMTASKSKTVVPQNIPIVVLINHGSASAAEILSGALKDNHRAYLIGERTYGKGSVQQVFPLREQDGFKMTMARYYTPSDTNIDKVGIPPDLEIKDPEMSEEQQKDYIEFINSGTIAGYVSSHPYMTEQDIKNYAEELSARYKFEPRLLRRLIRLECDRTTGAPLYDLDYDIQLNKALEIVKSSNYTKLVEATKTLKELQLAAEQASDISVLKK